MILSLYSRGVVDQIYVDLITEFINAGSAENRMVTTSGSICAETYGLGSGRVATIPANNWRYKNEDL